MKKQPYIPDLTKRLKLDRIARMLPDSAPRSCPQITTLLRRLCRRMNLPMVDVPEVARAIVAAVDRGELVHHRRDDSAYHWSEFSPNLHPLFRA